MPDRQSDGILTRSAAEESDFDPGGIEASATLLFMSDRATYRVSRIINELNTGLLARYSDVSVEGEVTNCTRSTAGHLYFTIKDEAAQLSVVLFGMYARSVRFRLENGLQVIVRGKLRIWEQRGTFQLNAVSVEPAGLGALQLAFEQLKARLREEGLFEADRKKPIPMLPQRIAVITSPTGAAIRDILNVLGRRFQGLAIQIYPVRVQGATAAREIAAAIKALSRWQLHDVILVCRGGGSLEDLWPFNEEIVARAVAACTIPTISGIGHETDFSICDLVADLRAPTPSAAAEIVVRGKEEICLRIDHSIARIRRVIEGKVGSYRYRLRLLSSSDGIGRFPARVKQKRERLQSRRVKLYAMLERQAAVLRRRLSAATEPLSRFPARLALRDRQRHVALMSDRSRRAMSNRLAGRRKKLEALVGTLQAVSPLSVLARGYAIAFAVRNGRRQLVTDSSGVTIGDPMEIQLRKGRVDCTVDRTSLGIETLWPLMKSD